MNSKKSEIEKLRKKYARRPSEQGIARLKETLLRNAPAWLVVKYLRRFSSKTSYQAKRESVTFFQRANIAYGAKKQRRSVRLIRIAFELIGPEIPKSYSILIINATNQTQDDASRRGAQSGLILDATKALAIDVTDATGWCQLSRGLFSVGYFRAAWVARENSLVLSIQEGSVADTRLNAAWRAIQAHLERRNFVEAEDILRKFSDQMTQVFITEIRDYLDLMQNKHVAHPIDVNSSNYEAEKLFRELVTGKNVALVGPGSPSGEYGTEIDSSDTVIRIKYAGREHLPPQKFHGHRCDISQYNTLDSLVALVQIDQPQKFIDDLKLILSVTSAPRKIQDRPVIVLSPSGPKSGLTYRTTSTSGIRGLFQILRVSPSEMTIFGYDFYSKLEQYSSEMLNLYKSDEFLILNEPFMYQGSGRIYIDKIAWGFSGHDPVSNFCFAQNLYKAGLFEIEPFGASILALTPYQYVERLEEMLGDW